MYCSNTIDIAKFILSILVVAIHTKPLGEYNFIIEPIIRLAVPLFFALSSYLFFHQVKNNKSPNVIIKFIIRITKLYISWFIVLFPLTFFINYSKMGGNLLLALKKQLIDFMLFYGFPASWFLGALIISTVIVYFFKDSFRLILYIISIIAYSICCLDTTYFNIINSIIYLNFKDYSIFRYISPANSFIAALFWTLIGEYKARNNNQEKINYRYYIKYIIIFLTLLYVENFVLLSFSKMELKAFDAYILLIPTVYYIFNVIISLDIKYESAVLLRKFSTIIYCTHFSVAIVIRYFLKKAHLDVDTLPYSLLVFLFTLAICGITCYIYKRFYYKINKKQLVLSKWLV